MRLKVIVRCLFKKKKKMSFNTYLQISREKYLFIINIYLNKKDET